MSFSPGPDTAADDENYIGEWKWGWLNTLAAAPLIVACFADTKWVIATGSAATIFVVGMTMIYLNSLCVRLRRTNIYLSRALPE